MRAGRCEAIDILIADPQDRQSSIAVCRLETGSLATSGNSERGKVHRSKKIGHIIDPRTGHPSPFGGSVTVKSDDPVVADAISTALFVMGPEAGRDWIQSALDIEVEALWIAPDGEIIWATPGFDIENTRSK